MHKASRSPAPLPGEGKRGVDGHIAYLLRQANAAVRLTLERAMARQNVTLPQYLVLTMLRAYPGLSGAGLARTALLTPQTMGLITRNLERLGAIEKAADPSNGRALCFTLTAHGGALLDACRQQTTQIERQMLEGLEPNDEAVIRRWLVGMAGKFGTDAGTNAPEVE